MYITMYIAKHELLLGYLNANREGNHIDKKTLELSLENTWLPSFAYDYIDYTHIPAYMKIITTYERVTLSHKHMVNVITEENLLERSIMAKYISWKTLSTRRHCLCFFQLLYLDECVAGQLMEKYGLKMMVVSSLFHITSKDLIVYKMKDCITLHTCGDVLRAIEI